MHQMLRLVKMGVLLEEMVECDPASANLKVQTPTQMISGSFAAALMDWLNSLRQRV